MAIKTYKPVTNGRRNMTSLTYEEITTNKPEKSLVAKKSKNGGRNNQGVITTRHHGGGHKQKYRIIDFKEIKIISQVKLQLLNMIQIDQQTSH